ncbi:DNA recombination protein RmuC [Hyphococcus flavus]|uniref:DNA recombination protein RmuC homolog n=1 Tax=Hyphococcus flavus TaxID=1866326 RepID=A0AAE9ZLG7_9PROT|nr:DNA recombination protein RmuC [Hyphococcus flavus]WDI32850.1 DNA recombination protein RmuC [Hyphococcus flavus]
MQSLTPSAQEEAEGLESVTTTAEEAAVPEPLFSGPAPALWAGFGAFILVFVLVIMLIIRGRVIKPGKRKTKHAPANYFEPAGDDADITFDDERPARSDDETEGEAEVVIEQSGDSDYDTRHSGDLNEASEEEPLEPEPVTQQKKKKSAFAGLFSKRTEGEAPQEPETDTQHHEEWREAAEPGDVDDYFTEPEPPQQASREAPQPAPVRDYAPAPQDDTRIRHAEDAAETAMRRAEEAEALARDLARANENTERSIKLGLRENEAAVTAMSERLTALAKEFQTRLDATASHAVQPAAIDHHEGLSEAHFAELADLLGEQFESLRSTVNDAIERLSRRIDHLPSAAPHAASSSAARVQLSDILSDALPYQRFELNSKLASGRTADACIFMPGNLAPIALDARFPVEAFDAWQRRAGDTEETELRRIILRHIADAGEKLIVAGETADCAMMFVPSEHILTQLHEHFPDLVQESYRAKIWMVSPTSLMATLHTISAVISGSGIAPAQRGADASEIENELLALRERVNALESARRQNGSGASHHAPQETAAAHRGEEPQAPESKPASQDDPSPFPLR